MAHADAPWSEGSETKIGFRVKVWPTVRQVEPAKVEPATTLGLHSMVLTAG